MRMRQQILIHEFLPWRQHVCRLIVSIYRTRLVDSFFMLKAVVEMYVAQSINTISCALIMVSGAVIDFERPLGVEDAGEDYFRKSISTSRTLVIDKPLKKKYLITARIPTVPISKTLRRDRN